MRVVGQDVDPGDWGYKCLSQAWPRLSVFTGVFIPHTSPGGRRCQNPSVAEYLQA